MYFVQFVVKISKLCNLRCRYCYELPELGNRARMSEAQLDAMFANIASYFRADERKPAVHFIWHGGEPLLQDNAYFERIFALQRQHFGDDVPVKNLIQTNLTMLDDDRLALLRKFDSIGVSIDLFGDLRVNVAGKVTQQRVLENMDRLQQEKIPFGCITVLTKRNLSKVEQIFRFYEKTGISFRVLPLFDGADDEQNQAFQISGQEALDGLCQLFDLWLASKSAIGIIPVVNMLKDVLRQRMPSFKPLLYDREAWESVIIVNTNGDLYSQADAYRPGGAWGNVFDTPLGTLYDGPERARSILDGNKRMAAACLHCEYLGACSGFPIAEDNRNYDDTLVGGTLQCIVERGVYRHIERRLAEAEDKFGPQFWTALDRNLEGKDPGGEAALLAPA